MTAPLFCDQVGTHRQMSFVVSKKVAASGTSKAKGGNITVETPAGWRLREAFKARVTSCTFISQPRPSV